MVKVGRIGEVWESRKIIGDAGGTWPIWKDWDPEKVMRARSMCPLSPWGGSRSSGDGWRDGLEFRLHGSHLLRSVSRGGRL